MATQKRINARIIPKHDIEANWNKAINFIPLKGEIIVYDADENYSYPRIKHGDGVTKVIDLPFRELQINWNQTDDSQKDFIQNRPVYEDIIDVDYTRLPAFSNSLIKFTRKSSSGYYAFTQFPYVVQLVENQEYSIDVTYYYFNGTTLEVETFEDIKVTAQKGEKVASTTLNGELNIPAALNEKKIRLINEEYNIEIYAGCSITTINSIGNNTKGVVYFTGDLSDTNIGAVEYVIKSNIARDGQTQQDVVIKQLSKHLVETDLQFDKYSTKPQSGISVQEAINQSKPVVSETLGDGHIQIIEDENGSPQVYTEGIGLNENLQTDSKDTLVDAINEVVDTVENYVPKSIETVNEQVVKYAENQLIKIDDISPFEHNINVKVTGKNLFDISKISTTPESIEESYISEVGDNYLIITTPEESDTAYVSITDPLKTFCPQLEVGKTYILNAETESLLKQIYLYSVGQEWQFGTAITITEELLNSAITIYGNNVSAGTCRISNIQVYEADKTVTEYSPYVDITSLNVNVYGKNLIDINSAMLNYDISHGSTVGSEFNSSTAIQAKKGFVVFNKIPVLPNAFYTFSLDNTDFWLDRIFELDSNSLITRHHSMYTSTNNDFPKYDIITKIGTASMVVRLRKKDGTAITLEDLSSINLQLERGSKQTIYEPYFNENYTPDTYGNISLSYRPYTTYININSDKVNMSVSYNKKFDGIYYDVQKLQVQQTINTSLLETLDQEHQKVSEAIEFNKTIKGDIIQLNDVSSVDHDIKVKVDCGRNLFNINKLESTAGITNNGDGSITVKHAGTTSNTLKELAPALEVGKTYIMSASTEAADKWIYIRNTSTYIYFNKAFVLTEEMLNSKISFYASYSVTNDPEATEIISNIQIEEGVSASEYEPYIDPTLITVVGCTKNLFDEAWEVGQLNTNTGEESSNSNSIRSVNYTTVRPKTTYTVSLPSGNNYYLIEYDRNFNFAFYGGLKNGTFTFTTNPSTTYLRLMQFGNTTIPANVQIELGSVATDYVSHVGNSAVLNVKGICSIQPISPSMQIFANIADRTIECEYNKDNYDSVLKATPKADWNENNPESPAYIKNRTHYYDPGTEKFYKDLICTNGTIAVPMDDGYGFVHIPYSLNFTVGQSYTVNLQYLANSEVIDNEEIVATAIYDTETLDVPTTMLIAEDDTPVAIVGMFIDPETGVITSSNNSSYYLHHYPSDTVDAMYGGNTTRITTIVDYNNIAAIPELKKIDAKFLPETEPEEILACYQVDTNGYQPLTVQPTISETELNNQFKDFFTVGMRYYVHDVDYANRTFKLGPDIGYGVIDQTFTMPAEGELLQEDSIVVFNITNNTTWSLGRLNVLGFLGLVNKPKNYDTLEFKGQGITGNLGQGYSNDDDSSLISFIIPQQQGQLPVTQASVGHKQILNSKKNPLNIWIDEFVATAQDQEAYSYYMSVSGKITFTDKSIQYEGTVLSVPLCTNPEETVDESFPASYPVHGIITWTDVRNGTSFKDYIETNGIGLILSSLCNYDITLKWRK